MSAKLDLPGRVLNRLRHHYPHGLSAGALLKHLNQPARPCVASDVQAALDAATSAGQAIIKGRNRRNAPVYAFVSIALRTGKRVASCGSGVIAGPALARQYRWDRDWL